MVDLSTEKPKAFSHHEEFHAQGRTSEGNLTSRDELQIPIWRRPCAWNSSSSPIAPRRGVLWYKRLVQSGRIGTRTRVKRNETSLALRMLSPCPCLIMTLQTNCPRNCQEPLELNIQNCFYHEDS